MVLFDKMLGAGESVFKNEDALDPEFVPKLLPYREQQQHFLANCIKPLLQERNGRNVFIFGAPGIGKTGAVRWVLRDLEENTDEIYTIYVNCWQKNTTFQVFVNICHQLDYMFTQNKRTEELLEVIKGIVNKKAAVFVFDEIDKVEDFDFLYSLLTEIYKRSIVLITNYKEWITELEDRLKSRLLPEMLEFKQYSGEETHAILKHRIEYAFVPGVWDAQAFALVADKAAEAKDIRVGIHLLRESGLAAEEATSRKILATHAQTAVAKLNEFQLKSSNELEEDTKLVLKVAKENSGQKIGDLFKSYKEKGGQGTYKTFQRKIAKLEKHQFIQTNKITGKEGNTTIVSVPNEKKITDF